MTTGITSTMALLFSLFISKVRSWYLSIFSSSVLKMFWSNGTAMSISVCSLVSLLVSVISGRLIVLQFVVCIDCAVPLQCHSLSFYHSRWDMFIPLVSVFHSMFFCTVPHAHTMRLYHVFFCILSGQVLGLHWWHASLFPIFLCTICTVVFHLFYRCCAW